MRDRLIGLLDEKLNFELLSHQIEALADHLLANGVTVQEWISVEDRLPEDSTYVLARLSGGVIYQALCLTNGSKQWYGATYEGFVNKDTVTYWMPLPQPPKGE